ncbi:MAG TPA: chemotaxis protein CheW, partial [bacterium]|nr:chemotaxis protein CheW [bacterium]
LTLALLEGLLVRVGRGFYVIPLTQIHKFSLWADRPEKPVASLPLPRLHLAEWFGVARGGEGNQVGVELESDKGPLLILVDEILGKREIVLKGLNPLMGCLKGVNGGAILGDGRVALVLDIPYLVRDFSRSILESGVMRPAAKALG